MPTSPKSVTPDDLTYLRAALRLAKRGRGRTSPNPMVGAVLVKAGRIIGRGWHRRAGGPHAEVAAIRDAQQRGFSPDRATLYVTLEPCCTQGRTPPCTEAIIAAGIRRVIVGTTDPNPRHGGRAFGILKRAGIAAAEPGAFGPPRSRARGEATRAGRLQAEFRSLARECDRLNEAFNHWIVHRVPFVTVKAAMSLDGKIATARGESKWITGEKARAHGMKMRRGADAILVGVNTIVADDPKLTWRSEKGKGRGEKGRKLRRFVLDSMARTPLKAKVVNDAFAALTTIVVSRRAPKGRVAALAKRVNVLIAPVSKSSIGNRQSPIHLAWLLKKLGAEKVTSLLVEGGGEVNAAFLLGGFAQRIAFFYAPKILGGSDSIRAVGGAGAVRWSEILQLNQIEWKRLGPDLMLTARVASAS